MESEERDRSAADVRRSMESGGAASGSTTSGVAIKVATRTRDSASSANACRVALDECAAQQSVRRVDAGADGWQAAGAA